jgi:hypothetical protein
MSMNDVEDVDFKEVTQSQMIDGNTQQVDAKPKHRVLHVQVGGNPNAAELQNVADSFQKALETNSVTTVTTTANVNCFNIYEEGEAPFNGVLVRGAITLADIARAIHDAEQAYLARGFKHWYDITDQQRAVYIKYVKDELRGIKHQFEVKDDDYNITKERLISAVVNALKPCLPAPQLANLVKAQVWNGGVDPTDNGSWVDVDFMNLKQGQVWRATGVTPVVYRHNVTDTYINYDGGTSFATVDCVEVLPVESTVEDKFALIWKLKAVVEAEQKAAEEAQAKADADALAEADAARAEGFATEEEVQALQDSPKMSEDAAPASEETVESFDKGEDGAAESQSH